MGRVKVNLTLESDVVETARTLGLNMSRLAEAAISEATKTECNRLWRTENRAAIATYTEEIVRDGLLLTPFRNF
ncbi:type II toxin-antitoxin system CcdA family antitoxin [Roseovarius sp. S1116L3]|uniref:type II toxin-antitoxin system CcdA family antitoxin n=1 Tax=Roseovarius roseus TaxID=3342636 RepID=UPI00372B27DE